MKRNCVCLFLNFPLSMMLAFLIIVVNGCNNHPASPTKNSAETALSTFTLEPGFKIELVASEPLINDPVAMMVDEYGKMYVVEMPGMPLNKTGLGRIMLLSDTNGDGRMDNSTVFADSLILPTGIMRWKKGVIITDPPNVYYMEDTNRDGKADIKETMLTGFDTSNLEANVNNPIYGIDNWIYLADLPVVKGGNIHYAADSNSLRLPESTIRFRPDTRQLEALSGKTQFGHTFDAWGNYLLVNNSNHIYQEIIASRYLKRNPDLIVSDATQTLADHKEVYSITKNPEYQMLTDVGVFTSACGITAYLGGAFPDKFNNNITFVAEPVSNLIHVDRLSDSGISFKANRMLERKEFLASTDPYCRMVNMYIGPDGALYVIDFYRQVIEGPEFMSEEVLKKVNLYNGTGTGRIYRVSATDAAGPVWMKGLSLGDATDEELVEKLNDKNIWWRLNSQRLLVDRNSNKALPSLIRVAQNSKKPMGRLHALWTLEGMHKLTLDLIVNAMKDPLPGIRENAIKLAELHLATNPGLVASLLTLKDDPDAKVRFQLLCTLGFINTPEIDRVRQQLLFTDINDKWVQIAALSASSSQSVSLLNAVLLKFDPSVRAYASLVQLLSGIIGKSQNTAVIQGFLKKALNSNEKGTWQVPVIEGLAEGLGNRLFVPNDLDAARSLLIKASLGDSSNSIRQSSVSLLKVIGLTGGVQTEAAMLKAVTIADNAHLSQEYRAGAINFIALRNPQPFIVFLKKLVSPQNPLLIQLAALRTLSIIPGENITNYFLEQWPTLSPELRNEAINTFLATDQRIKLFLDKIESGAISQGAISWPQSVRIRSDGKYRDRARALLTPKDDNRKEIIDDYQAALKMEGTPAKGRSVYQMNCAVCHQVGGKTGIAFGPDLGTVHGWAPADIMTNILDPNRSIAHGYDMWVVKLLNGKEVQGIISTETPTAITLRNTVGQVTN
ncbi:MAG: PVC-type heme-binding CxxCH protein, partial [Ferruginibacter sp.]